MNHDQKIARLSNAQQVLARRTSELFEPGYDPYNSLKTKHVTDDVIHFAGIDAITICKCCGARTKGQQCPLCGERTYR